MLIDKVVLENETIYGVDTDATSIPVNRLISAAQLQLYNLIDTAAGNARASFVSPGSYIDQEYLLAKQEAQTWLDGGKDTNAIPSSVEDHMAMFEVDAEAAAQEIVATAEAWETALREIRQLRLGGKAAVQRADTIEAAEAAAKEAIEQLNRYRPTEG
ncbi:hypothetical protein BIS09_14915 [Halomonas sp. R1t8]|jgi:hypothetical protein|uniref:hypothetical protein n=1 Tax=unclassified Halomonas TaxID=2609666 RepID=UPI00209C72B2|nr:MULTISPECIES: hypothetical protein [unclassified Halomonas]MCP1305121.1 hypothetical protein [Halomonas sp. R1t8]MCP1331427.1 hypothetical protein [Halomonas sp. R1t4]